MDCFSTISALKVNFLKKLTSLFFTEDDFLLHNLRRKSVSVKT